MLQRAQPRSNPSERRELTTHVSSTRPEPYMSSRWALMSAQKRSAECALVELQTQHDREVKQYRMGKMELESEKMQLEQSCNILKVKNESLVREKEHTSTQLQDSEKQFYNRMSDLVRTCNTVESSLSSEVELLRQETTNQQKRITELEQSEARNKARLTELEATLEARAERLKELETFVSEKQQTIEECDRMKEALRGLEETKRTLESRLAMSENRVNLPPNHLSSVKGPTYVVKLEMEHERVKTAYKTLSKERADWLITKEENEELRTQVQQLKQWRQRALTAENALEEQRNLADLNSSSSVGVDKSGQLISPSRLNYLERENQLLLAETGELRAHSSELQSKLNHTLNQLQAMTEHRDKLLECLRRGPSQGSVHWTDADLLTTPIQKLTESTEPAKSSELVMELRHRISELEDQLSKSESQRISLEEKVEQFELKGFHEPQSTRILTLKANPAAEVKETLFNEVTRLRQENERFRQRIQVLEECTRRLRQRQTQNTHPLVADEPTMGSVTMVVDQRLNEHPDPLSELEAVREQLRVEKLRGDRLMELFDKASARFRGAFRDLLGYRVDVRPSDEYKVRPVFTSDPQEYLMFQRVNGQLVLKENDFSLRLSDSVRTHLNSTSSYPGFFAALTLSYVQQTTMVT